MRLITLFLLLSVGITACQPVLAPATATMRATVTLPPTATHTPEPTVTLTSPPPTLTL